MTYCIHSVPGRARFKVPQLRGDAEALLHLEGKMLTVDGVIRVETNPHSASVIVYYDIETNPLDQVVHHIREHSGTNENGVGRFNAPVRSNLSILSKPANGSGEGSVGEAVSRTVGQVVGQAIFATLVQRTLERSLMSILTGFFH